MITTGPTDVRQSKHYKMSVAFLRGWFSIIFFTQTVIIVCVIATASTAERKFGTHFDLAAEAISSSESRLALMESRFSLACTSRGRPDRMINTEQMKLIPTSLGSCRGQHPESRGMRPALPPNRRHCF